MNKSVFANMTERLQAGTLQRVIALTNNGGTAFPGLYYWFDIFAKAVRRRYGMKHQFLNTDYYKNTAIMLDKFDSDATPFRPNLAVVLICGTEFDGPDNKSMSLETTAANLRELHHRLQDLNCDTVFMTYYQLDVEKVESGFMQHFVECMDLVREAAAETGAGLIDHMRRWDRLRLAFPQTYQLLMADPCHPNNRGHMLMGLDMARYFDAAVSVGLASELDDALAVQAMMDNLEKNN